MVTTRSSTGSLPAKDKATSRSNKRSKQNDRPEESGPTIGENDKFSRLPYEILVMIWDYCRPIELVHLCRTSKVFRIYLTRRSAQNIWIAARKRMSVQAQAYWPRHAGGIGYMSMDRGQSWPRICAIPDPPPYLTEISWADFLWNSKCSYCSTGKPSKSTKIYGTYHAACEACERGRKYTFAELQQTYKDMDIADRFYSILPHYLLDEFTRIFWKPTCDELQREMADFEVSIGWDEAAMQSWITAKRKIVNDHLQGKQTKAQFGIWKNAYTYSKELRSADRQKRNTAMFLHLMGDKDFDPRDLQEFCRMQKNAFWLRSDRIIFPKKTARKDVEKNKDLLDKIRIFREEHEAAQKLKPASDRIMKLISASVKDGNAQGRTFWNLDHTEHMADILALPALAPILEAIIDGRDSCKVMCLWNAHWNAICEEMIELEDEWLEMLLLLVVGAKRAEVLVAQDHISPVYTSFVCDKCTLGGLVYPSVFDHRCFCTRVDSPHLSEKADRYRPTRSLPLNLDGIRYDASGSEKLSKLAEALEAAGHGASSYSALNVLPGRFKCLDCPENERSPMYWKLAKEHICVTTYYRELQETGERELKSRKHMRLEYIPLTP